MWILQLFLLVHANWAPSSSRVSETMGVYSVPAPVSVHSSFLPILWADKVAQKIDLVIEEEEQSELDALKHDGDWSN